LARLIAFHVGQGDWTSVAAARALFPGHEPDVPGELGFYDLRVPEVRLAQAGLARQYGIHAFSYLYRWSNGRGQIEQPLDEMLASGKPELSFCLTWIDEEPRPDGAANHVVLGGSDSEDDDREHYHWLARAFQDRRYFRIGSRPLVLAHRVAQLPDAARTTHVWRDRARALGMPEPFLCSVESPAAGAVDPRRFGFDAAVELQPDWNHAGSPEQETQEGHQLFDYERLIERQSHKPRAGYLRFPCVAPGWDDSPRRERGARIVGGSRPALFQRWLEAVLESRTPPDPELDLVFINSWNSWGEGSQVEPSRSRGRGYLEATRQALRAVSARAMERERRLAPPVGVDARPPAVSVCIPTFNGARCIAATLQSVLGQTLADIEVVVVDDASSDDTAEIARAFGDPRVSVKVNATRLGIAGNWNRCLEYARAPLVCIFHQDDLMMPANLAQKAAFLESYPRAGMVFSNVWQIGPRDEVLSRYWYFPPDPADEGLHPGEDFFRRLLLGPNIVCCPSVVCRREVFDVLGGFDTSMQFTLDWEMWLRIASRYPVGYLTEALVQYRRHPGMETGRFEGVAELEHGLEAKLLALDRAPDLLPDIEELRAKVLDGSVREALGRARLLLRDGRRGEAVPYLAFTLALPATTGGSVSISERVARIVAETAFVFERPAGSPATAGAAIEDRGTEDVTLTGSVDEPRPFAQVEGELIVRGWARVPGEDLGVAFDLDGVRREPSSIRRGPRPDVAVVFPGIGDTSRTGFEARFPVDGQIAGARTLTVTFRSRDGRYRQAGPILFHWPNG